MMQHPMKEHVHVHKLQPRLTFFTNIETVMYISPLEHVGFVLFIFFFIVGGLYSVIYHCINTISYIIITRV